MKRFQRDNIEADLIAFKEAVTDAVGAFGADFPRKIFGKSVDEEFVDDRLPRLSLASRIDLMKIVYRMAMAETTQPTQPEDADEKKRMMGLLAKIYSSFQPDPAYAEYTRRQRLAFRDFLLDDRHFLEMRSGGWNEDIASRPHFLKHVMVLQNRVMSHKSLGFQACGLHFGWAYQGSEASYDNGQIAFRAHWADPEFTLKNGMRCLLHENTHAHQDQIGMA